MPALISVIVSALLSLSPFETQVILFASFLYSPSLSSVVEFDVKLSDKVTSSKMPLSVDGISFGVSSRVAPPISSSPVMSVFLIVTVLAFGVSSIVTEVPFLKFLPVVVIFPFSIVKLIFSAIV